MDKKTLIPVAIAVVVGAGALLAVVAGRGADTEAARACTRAEPPRGAWSSEKVSARGLRVYREQCARCHGFTDEGALCVRGDAAPLPNEPPKLAADEWRDVAKIATAIANHRISEARGDMRMSHVIAPPDLEAAAELLVRSE